PGRPLPPQEPAIGEAPRVRRARRGGPGPRARDVVAAARRDRPRPQPRRRGGGGAGGRRGGPGGPAPAGPGRLRPVDGALLRARPVGPVERAARRGDRGAGRALAVVPWDVVDIR